MQTIELVSVSLKGVCLFQLSVFIEIQVQWQPSPNVLLLILCKINILSQNYFNHKMIVIFTRGTVTLKT